MPVIQSKIYKNEPKNFSSGGGGPPGPRVFDPPLLRPKEFYRAGTAPRGCEITGSATECECNNLLMQKLTIAKAGNKIKLFNVWLTGGLKFTVYERTKVKCITLVKNWRKADNIKITSQNSNIFYHCLVDILHQYDVIHERKAFKRLVLNAYLIKGNFLM